MTQQQRLFDDDRRRRGACPACGGPVAEVDIAEAGCCEACGIALIRSDTASPWETFSNHFGGRPKAPRRKRASKRPRPVTVSENYLPRTKGSTT